MNSPSRHLSPQSPTQYHIEQEVCHQVFHKLPGAYLTKKVPKQFPELFPIVVIIDDEK